MQVLRFLQISDLHLDSSLTAGRLGLPPEKVRIRQSELRSILPRACALAREREVDVMLLPGDLFDDEAVSMDTINFVIESLSGLDPIPVLIAPGNHDFYSLGSPYNNEFLAARRQRPWPRNVKVFREGSWEVWRASPESPFAATGMAHAAGASIGERLIAGEIPGDEGATFSLLLFHGSRENIDLPRGKMRTLPFTDGELADRGFDYAAIGHYHGHAEIRDSSGRIVGAYAGCPAGRGMDEAGEKSVIIGEIRKEDGEPAEVSLERVVVDKRRIHLVEVQCSGLTHRDAILRRAEEQVTLRECRSDDIVCVRLAGRVSPGIDLRIQEGFLADRFFHVMVDSSRLRPGYDLERYGRKELRTTEARFAREMIGLMEKAADPEERRILENALYYGLDALIHKEVSPRYEE